MADDFQFNFRGFYPVRGFRSPRMPEDTDPLLFNDPDSLLARDIRAYMDVAATGRQPETLRFLEDERKEHGMVNYLRGMDRAPAPAAQQVGNGFQLNSATQQPPPALPTGTPQQVADLQAEYAQNAKRIDAIRQEIAQLEKGALTDDQLDMALAANRAEIGDLGNSLLHQNRIATRKATDEARDWNAEQARLNREATRDYTTSQRIKELTAAIEDIDIELPRVQNAESRDKLKAKRQRMQKELDELNGAGFKFNFKGGNGGDEDNSGIQVRNGQLQKIVRLPNGKSKIINLYGRLDNAKYLDSADGTAMTPDTAKIFMTEHTTNGHWDSDDDEKFYTMNIQKNTPEGAEAAKTGAKLDTVDEAAEKVRKEKEKNEAAVNEAMKLSLEDLEYKFKSPSDTITIPKNGRNVKAHIEGDKYFFEAGSGNTKVRKEYKPQG